MKSFAKVIEMNQSGSTWFNMRSVPDINAILENKSLKKQMKAPAMIKLGQSAIEVYKSDHLQVSQNGIQGYIRKAIENKSVFHRTDYHKKYMKLEFSSPNFYFYEEVGSGIPSRTYLQADIISCEILDDAEIEQKVTDREEKRSKSLLRRMTSKSAKRCKWNFAFQLKVVEGDLTTDTKEYELYAPTRNDRAQWVKILSIIAEMNR